MIVENGEGLENADSYVGIEFADNYFSSRNPSWALKEESEKESALIKATDYVNSVFQWHGRPKTQEQALAFPRVGLFVDGYSVSGIPTNLKKAVCVVAMQAIKGLELFTTEEQNGDVASESVDGAVSVSYFQGTKKENLSVFQEVNALLRGMYFDSSKKQIVTSRVIK